MSSFNQVILLGRLSRDPQLRYLPSQSAVVEFGMACNRKWKDAQGQDRDEAMFIDCQIFGKAAEVINQYCHKGNLLMIEGRLKFDTWEDKQGGGKRSKHVVVVENFQLMPNRDSGTEAAPQTAPAPRSRLLPPEPRKLPQGPTQPPYDEQPSFKEDDIPF